MTRVAQKSPELTSLAIPKQMNLGLDGLYADTVDIACCSMCLLVQPREIIFIYTFALLLS